MHANYIAIQLVHLNHVASKQSFVTLAPHSGCIYKHQISHTESNAPHQNLLNVKWGGWLTCIAKAFEAALYLL